MPTGVPQRAVRFLPMARIDESQRPMNPKVKLNGRKISFNGRKVGQYATDETTGKIVLVFWKSLFRIHNSYAMSADLYDRLDKDIDTYYVVDNESNRCYRYSRETYKEADVKWGNKQSQYCPDVEEHDGVWDKDDILV